MDNNINEFIMDIKLPKIVKVKQSFPRPVLKDPGEELLQSIIKKGFAKKIKNGETIAITAGSRGIANYKLLMNNLIKLLKYYKAKPFIVPAMGSHGGGTSEGQVEVLKKLGITEEALGVPIKSSSEVVQIGKSKDGLPIYVDKIAYNADSIILLNRIKPHTSFRGKHESGLAKMLAVGLGNRKGAEAVHSLTFNNMSKHIVNITKQCVEKLNIKFCLGIIENAYDEIAEIHVLDKSDIISKEPKLLEKSKSLTPRLYLDKLDILVIKEIGKDISATGMDTNIIGRYHTKAASGGPNINKIIVLNLTEKSKGNANGIGLADYTTKRLVDKIDLQETYLNVITSTEPSSVKIPMYLDDDLKTLQAAIKACGHKKAKDVRLVLIKNTNHLDEIYVSESLVKECKTNKKIEIIGKLEDIDIDIDGNLILF